jgi:hypothetical protein
MIQRKMETVGEPGEPGVESFTDDQIGGKYRRIVGAMAWPFAAKQGFAVVIAEDFDEDPNLKARHLWVLQEVEEIDVADLIRRCQDFRETFQAKHWVGNTRNKSMMSVLYHLGKKWDHKERFSFNAAPHADDPQGLGYYLPIIKEQMAINRKVLHFGEGSKLPGYLAEMAPETLNQDPAEYPPIAALGYALAHVSTSGVPRKFTVSPPKYSREHSWM